MIIGMAHSIRSHGRERKGQFTGISSELAPYQNPNSELLPLCSIMSGPRNTQWANLLLENLKSNTFASAPLPD